MSGVLGKDQRSLPSQNMSRPHLGRPRLSIAITHHAALLLMGKAVASGFQVGTCANTAPFGAVPENWWLQHFTFLTFLSIFY